MTTNSRKELLEALRTRYCLARKKERIEILESLIQTTGYSRKHAITLLNNNQKKCSPRKKGRKNSLGFEAQEALIQIWHVSNQLCGKRLAPFIEEICENLETHGYLKISAAAKTEILSVSAATIDRSKKRTSALPKKHKPY